MNSSPKRGQPPPPHYRRDMDDIDMPQQRTSANLAASMAGLDVDLPPFAGPRPTYSSDGPPGPAPSSNSRHPPPSRRGVPPEHGRSPPRDGPAMRSRAPSYEAGSRSAEMLSLSQDKPGDGGEMSRRRGHRQSRTNSRPQSATSANFPPSAHQLQPESPTFANTNGGAPGKIPPRLKTPSVMDSVLHPLGQKVQEYDRLMREGQDEMARLDEELRTLQARRDEAEGRYLDARARHEEWRQQYTDVERALKGELPPPRQAPQVTFQEDDDDDDDDDDLPLEPPRPIIHQDSFDSSKSKSKVKSLLRRSFFGGS